MNSTNVVEPVMTSVTDVYHRPDAEWGEHSCQRRITAVCRSCRRERVLCAATPAEVRAMMRRGWRCGDCEPTS